MSKSPPLFPLAGLPLVSSSRLLNGTAAVFAVLLTTFAYKLVKHRSEWRRLNLPGPPHSFLWGHLRVMDETRKAASPGPNAHMDYSSIYLTRQYGQLVFMDLWPFSQPLCIVSEPNVADRVARGDNIPKNLEAMAEDYPVLGGMSIVLAASDEDGNKRWQRLRKALNPGFRKGHLERAWTADIVEEVSKMVDRMDNWAANNLVFSMSPCLTDTTCDIILKVAIGSSDQRLREQVLKVLNAQLDNASKANHAMPILDVINPVRRYGEWKRTRQMDSILGAVVDEHIAAAKTSSASTDSDDQEKKDVFHCALAEEDMSHEEIISQIKTLVFAGHDTTSVTLSWTYYHLAQDPVVLDKLRDEHTKVFGPEIGQEAKKIVDDPQILNELKYTNAVLKETLRMYPPAAAARQSPSEDYVVYDKKAGRSYPVAGCLIWLCHAALHRHPDNFEDPDTFKPERWLDEAGEAIATPLAWQPFSRGPKNCVGMELALIEQRILLAMTARRFDYSYADDKPPYQVYKLTSRPNNGILLRLKKNS